MSFKKRLEWDVITPTDRKGGTPQLQGVGERVHTGKPKSSPGEEKDNGKSKW